MTLTASNAIVAEDNGVIATRNAGEWSVYSHRHPKYDTVALVAWRMLDGSRIQFEVTLPREVAEKLHATLGEVLREKPRGQDDRRVAAMTASAIDVRKHRLTKVRRDLDECKDALRAFYDSQDSSDAMQDLHTAIEAVLRGVSTLALVVEQEGQP